MVIEGGRIIAGSGLGSPLLHAGAPVNGVTAVQTLTSAATGGTIALSFGGYSTGPLAHNASAATIQAALLALPSIGAAGVACTGGAWGAAAVIVTFGGNLAGLNVAAIGVDNTLATGGVVSQAFTTAGVTGTERHSAPGALLIDTTGEKEYQNTGTALLPVWTKVGTET